MSDQVVSWEYDEQDSVAYVTVVSAVEIPPIQFAEQMIAVLDEITEHSPPIRAVIFQ